MPLALLAYENIRRSHTLDANRVYVGGMSGGSRVALRVALAYPDVFRGALLNAGSDPIGDGAVIAASRPICFPVPGIDAPRLPDRRAR